MSNQSAGARQPIWNR